MLAQIDACKQLVALDTADEYGRPAFQIDLKREPDDPLLQLPAVIPVEAHERVWPNSDDWSRPWPPSVLAVMFDLANIGSRHKAQRCAERRRAIGVEEGREHAARGVQERRMCSVTVRRRFIRLP